jgi:ABC-2 type transport system permease protein
MRLALTYARFKLLEVFRIPVSFFGLLCPPLIAVTFFVLPLAGDNPQVSTMVLGSMAVFGVVIICIMEYAADASQDRETTWYQYLRTLPAGPVPQFVGRILFSLVLIVCSVVPAVAVGAIFTEASASVPQILAAAGVLLLAVVPFSLIGLAAGYAIPAKSAVAVGQLLFLPLAFGGGLFSDPYNLPGFIEVISPFLPTRGIGDLMWYSLGGPSPLVVWTVVRAVVAAWAYRRDEGRRYH